MRSFASDELVANWQKRSPIHGLNAGVKTAVTLLFIVVVVSFPKYAVAPLCPYFFYLALVVALADLPVRPLVRRLVVVSPFALLVGVFNPVLDRDPMELTAGLAIAGGWVSFTSIILRFVLTVGAALVLAATTPFHRICASLRSAGVPRPLVAQLLLLSRYLAVLVGEARALLRARSLRSAGNRGLGPRSAAAIVATLFIRTVERAQRIFEAMSARGFDGELRLLPGPPPRAADWVFATVCCGSFLALRFSPAVYWLGRVSLG